jgi:hypothetical protein
MTCSDEPSEAIAHALRHLVFRSDYERTRAYTRNDLPSSVAVKQYYLQLKAAAAALDFDEVGLSVFSQNNEDGILLHLLARTGMPAKRCVEIGCDLSGSTVGIPEGNTVNLISNFNFDGLIIDMDGDKLAAIRHYFAQALPTKHFHAPSRVGKPAGYYSPSVVHAEITPENINRVLEDAGFSGEIDVLSIDVDGPDVHIWRSVTVASARIVVIEVNARLPFDQAVYGGASVSGAPPDTLEHQMSWGSSLAAACAVATEKGYVFVGMNSTLINAFFVRADAWVPELPPRRAAEYNGHRMNPLRPRT